VKLIQRVGKIANLLSTPVVDIDDGLGGSQSGAWGRWLVGRARAVAGWARVGNDWSSACGQRLSTCKAAGGGEAGRAIGA
jgi:hypothetical protein